MKEWGRQETEDDESLLDHLKQELWSVRDELLGWKNTPIWKKIDFFQDWLTSILEIADAGDVRKPVEPIIAHLAETNVYLTRKLTELERNTPHSTTTMQKYNQTTKPGTRNQQNLNQTPTSPTAPPRP